MPQTEGGNAPTRRRAREPMCRRRAAAVHRRTTAPPRGPRVSTACVSPARTSRVLLGQRARVPHGVRALAAALSVRPPHMHAKGRRTPRFNALVTSLRGIETCEHTRL
jgi:hypothetical protein